MSNQQQLNTLAVFRKHRGLVQSEAARFVDCTAKRISDFEQGRRQPTLEQAAIFSVAYADDPATPVPIEQLLPLLYARVRTKTAKQWKAINRSRHPTTYASKPHTTTVLALYAGTPHTLGLAVFETPQACESVCAQRETGR
jgi:transcriptional regulator with XRE-family HTH domain